MCVLGGIFLAYLATASLLICLLNLLLKTKLPSQ